MRARALLLLGGAGLLALALAWQHRGCSPREPAGGAGRRPLNVVLCVIDTLRSDRLCGPRGEPALMPRARAFAQRGVLFPNAVAPAPWTLPSMASLLTGSLPVEHRVERMPSGPPRLGPVPTYARALASRGYQVAAYTGGPWSWAVPGSLLDGFPIPPSRPPAPPPSTALHLKRAEDRLETWRRGLQRSRPFFLLLHSFEAHDPYGEREHPAPGEARTLPPPGFDPTRVLEPWERARRFLLSRAEREALQQTFGVAFMQDVVRYLWSGYRQQPRPELARELEAAYDAGVAWVDRLLGEILDWFERHGLLEDTVFILTSDHGEAFGEHGTLEHGRQAYDEVVRVPLVLVGPAPLSGGRVLTSTVSLLDALPTALDLAGEPMPPGMRGTSLRPVIEGREGGRIAPVQERVDHEVSQEDIDLVLRALRSDRWKAIATWDTRSGEVRWEAYDLEADPGEARDLAGGRGSLEGLAFDPAFAAALAALREELRAEGAGVGR